MADRAIPVTLRLAPAQKEKKYYTLPISVTVPAPSLTLLPQGEGSQAKATIYVGVVDDSGYTRDIGREEAIYTLPKDAPANASLNYVVRLQTRKGIQRSSSTCRTLRQAAWVPPRPTSASSNPGRLPAGV